jgi:hypothetical protein
MMDILDIVEGGGNTSSIRTLLRKYLPSRYVARLVMDSNLLLHEHQPRVDRKKIGLPLQQ